MKAYLKKQLVYDTSTTKKEIWNFTGSEYNNIAIFEVKREPEYWRNFDSREQAIESLTMKNSEHNRLNEKDYYYISFTKQRKQLRDSWDGETCWEDFLFQAEKRIRDMKTIKVECSEHSVHISCPHCDNWESMGIDDPRKRLNAIPITEWLEDRNGFELSKHKCTECTNEFLVEWDYKNEMV